MPVSRHKRENGNTEIRKSKQARQASANQFHTNTWRRRSVSASQENTERKYLEKRLEVRYESNWRIQDKMTFNLVSN